MQLAENYTSFVFSPNIWQERLSEPLRPIGTMIASRAIEGKLPLDGCRFAGQIPPVVSAPVLAVRKRASRVFTLHQYVEAEIITEEKKQQLSGAIGDHRNTLAVGGTGEEKTTLTNGLIHEVTEQFPAERIVVIEDTGEIQYAARNYVQYHTSPDVNMTQLLRTTLRMRPDRILVGEVRGPEALDLLMSCNTVHEGGIVALRPVTFLNVQTARTLRAV
jgi:type IV secretion system protein TrbB